MPQHVLTAFFDSRSEAEQAIDQLQSLGVPRSQVRILPDVEDQSASTATAGGSRGESKGFWASLGDLFLPEENRYSAYEALSRGTIVVTATVDDSEVERATDVLERYGTVNLDERATRGVIGAGDGAPAASSTDRETRTRR